MIVRDEGSTLLLITQPDHAQLAGDIVAAMRTEPALAGVSRETVLLATREHDNGWREIDASPGVDPTGRPYDFIRGPARMKHEVWHRGISRVAQMNLRAGALVAEHALTVYGYRTGEAEWREFFDSITNMRDDLLQQVGAMEGAARDAFDREYRVIRLGDAFSLQLCNGWMRPQGTLGYRSWLEDSTLVISPDPFDGATLPLRVLARRIPARRYANAGDLQDALAAVIPEILVAKARGPIMPPLSKEPCPDSV